MSHAKSELQAFELDGWTLTNRSSVTSGNIMHHFGGGRVAGGELL